MIHKNDFSVNEIGRLIRLTRKSKGLILDDLVDDFVSRATISQIERGKCNNMNKIRYVARKLEINLPDLSEKERKAEEKRQLELMLIENNIIFLNPRRALRWLKKLDINETHKPLISYFRGRCHFKLKKYDHAKEHHLKCLREMERLHGCPPSNIKACCLNELSIIEYIENKLDKALAYIQEAIDTFQPKGDRQYIYPTLLINKSIYLNKLGETEKALNEIERLELRSCQVSIDTIIGLMDMKASLKMKLNMYDDAKEWVEKGIELARINSNYNRSLELLTRLGQIYRKKQELSKAELCLLEALALSEKITTNRILPDTYLELGQVYLEQGKYERAKDYLNQGLEIAKKENNMIKYLKNKLGIGKALLKTGAPESAVIHLSEAMELGENTEIFPNILLTLSKCYLEIGDQTNYHRVSSMYLRTIDD